MVFSEPRSQVLLVDDNPQNLKVLFDTLEGSDYRLLLANNGKKALAIAEKLKPDLILLDIMMPEMDGYEVCDTLKSNPSLRDIPVIFLSALDDVESKVKGFEKGGIDYIAKPFQPKEVVSRVATQIKLRRLEQQLKEKNRELSADNIEMQLKLEAQREHLAHFSRLSTMGEMAAGFAHEVNQPLTAITNYARVALRLLGEDLDDNTVVNKKMLATTLNKLEAQSHRASDVIQRIRGFVKKPQSGKTIVDVRSLLSDVVQFAEVDVKNNKGQVVLKLPDELPTVEADAIQVQQVALNLIRNALEATSACPQETDGAGDPLHVSVSAYADKQMIWVEVKDQGCGFTEDAEQKLFHPFFTTKGDGMGIGLSLCQSLIQAQGGKIGFRRNPDKGITFYFSLPICAR
ncbi:sensor histidine kinase [Alkalimarinus alittae]|uniref:histidine kinase n=1 Tax=Alkalimarinus alittae TaxID=2961619 RepID=A0ABY6MZ03_9ALTE|nr:response regulator [Alkalimarinus alittae]UZE95054.1 response regulator [Alkalimarinus alittae]